MSHESKKISMTKQASMHIRFASLNLMGIEVSLVSHNSNLNTRTYVILANKCTLEAQILEAFFVPFILQHISC